MGVGVQGFQGEFFHVKLTLKYFQIKQILNTFYVVEIVSDKLDIVFDSADDLGPILSYHLNFISREF